MRNARDDNGLTRLCICRVTAITSHLSKEYTHSYTQMVQLDENSTKTKNTEQTANKTSQPKHTKHFIWWP